MGKSRLKSVAANQEAKIDFAAAIKVIRNGKKSPIILLRNSPKNEQLIAIKLTELRLRAKKESKRITDSRQEMILSQMIEPPNRLMAYPEYAYCEICIAILEELKSYGCIALWKLSYLPITDWQYVDNPSVFQAAAREILGKIKIPPR